MSLKCLVIENESMMKKVIKDLLFGQGVQGIEYAESGRVAKEMLEQSISTGQKPYDVVIFDWDVPEIDGLTLLKDARSNDAFNNTAFVVFSSETGKEQVMQAVQAGATSYIQKPSSEKDFTEKFKMIKKWLENHKS